MARGARAAAALCGLLVLVAGCGDDGGVGEGATVTVYAGKSYCAPARRVLEGEGGRAGAVRVRLRCLPATEEAGVYDLARIGSNARIATEDSTTVAYIGEAGARATEFSGPILEAAGIAQLSRLDGSEAMQRVLAAIRGADTGSQSLREAVESQLG